jgi:leader peptidase (prepilin peptidase) / N-methyltransferase
LGFGDVTLSGVMGLLLGWPGIMGGLLIAIGLGGVFSLLFILIKLITKKYQAFSSIPYAPFIIFGSLILIYLPD